MQIRLAERGARTALRACVLFCFSFGLMQAGVIVGIGNSGNCYPFTCNQSTPGQTMEYQQVYSASAFSGPIDITSLSLFQTLPGVGTNSGVLSGNYDISFSITSAPVSGLSANLASNIGADSATFFNGMLGGAFVNGVFTIAGSPFSYDQSDGTLLIDIVVTNQATVGISFMAADDTGSVTSRAEDLTGFGPEADSDGLVTGFNIAPEPSTCALLAVGALGLLFRRRKPAA